MQAVSAVVSGRVQGVGFRYSTQAMGQRLQLVGWVRNQADGSVATHAQGDKSAVANFVAYLQEGPRAARVDSVEVAAIEPDPSLSGFQVRY
jgi:acylphosphatase